MTSQISTATLDRTFQQEENTSWAGLYRLAGGAVLLTAVFIPIQIAVFLLNPPPASVPGWFSLFRAAPLTALLDLDLLLLVDQVLAVPVFLALYMALRRTHPALMLATLALSMLAAVLFIASNPGFAMLNLSQQYAAAAEGERAGLLAAGQAVMSQYNGSAFQVSYLVGALALIAFSAVMLRNQVFSRATAYLGIAANVIALGLYVPRVGVYISVFSVVFLWVWYLLLGIRFLQLGRPAVGAAD
ncbi:MAG TPA: hypothetical protein VF813_01225 [Anaerolineaceae bacterium]